MEVEEEGDALQRRGVLGGPLHVRLDTGAEFAVDAELARRVVLAGEAQVRMEAVGAPQFDHRAGGRIDGERDQQRGVQRARPSLAEEDRAILAEDRLEDEQEQQEIINKI